MCIVSLAWQAHPDWKLIVIGNRDELHARPAEALARWQSHDHLMAGRDSRAGGTWLGLSEQGRFAVVTNVSGFGAPDPALASRGDLLKDFLSGEGRYAALDKTRHADFNPFNLITISGDTAAIHANRPEAVSRTISPGIHSLSNGPLKDPWPKARYLDQALQAWLDDPGDDPVTLLDILRDQKSHQPEGRRIDPRDLMEEPRHSPLFIRNPVYGTRCSTLVAIDQAGTGSIIERRYDQEGATTGESRLAFRWPG